MQIMKHSKSAMIADDKFLLTFGPYTAMTIQVMFVLLPRITWHRKAVPQSSAPAMAL